MNKELLIILSELKYWAVSNNTVAACKGNYLNIADWGKCEFHCMSCWLLQPQTKKYYADTIIETFSQLNK